MPKVDIYVKHPTTNKWDILDLFEDESINLSFKLKDLNDISKVFSTFSQDFVVPASNNNNKTFNYFFTTTLQRVRERGLEAKIYVNDALFRTGQIIIKQGKYEHYKLTSYSIEFKTVIGAIKDKIGDDKLSDVIGDVLNNNFSMDWSSQSVYDKIVTLDGQPNKDLLVPLVSINRVWSYNDGTSSDIKVPANGINKNELRPAIKLSVILDLLFNHYDMDVDFPLKTTNAFSKLYMWLNGKSEDDSEFNLSKTTLFFNQPFNPYLSSNKYFFDVTTTTQGYLKVTDTGASFNANRTFVFVPELLNIKNPETNATYDKKAKLILTEIETGLSQTIDGVIWGTTMQFKFNIAQKTAGTVRTYKLDVEFEDSLSYSSVYCTTSATLSISEGLSQNALLSTNNPGATPTVKFNIKFVLGEWKVIDLFSSIFKMFNIRVVEDYNNFSMRWLTPIEFYSQFGIKNINKYTDVSEYTIAPSTQYKQIQFKHNDEGYFRNKEYKALVNKDYGSEIFKSTDTTLNETYSVETKFSIMNWFIMNGTTLKTSYGFGSVGSPHNPSTPTIFYNEGFSIIRNSEDTQNVDFRFKIPSPSNPNFTNQLAGYIKFGNQDSTGINYTNSVTFDIDINPVNNNPMLKSLYANYYAQDIERLYLPNANYYNFEGYLNLSGIINFSMQEFLNIEDNVYTIEEANIDITTGQFKFKLLNYLNNIETITPIYPPEINAFFADGGYRKLSGGVNTNTENMDIVSHYEIQYRRQGDNNWTTGLNLPFVPFVSQTWEILNVAPAGLYDVRCRTVSFDGLTSGWAYDYGNNVTGFIPVEGIPINIGDSPIKYDPCAFFPPTKIVKPWNPIRVNPVFSPVEFDLIDVGTELFLDKELTQKYIPSGTFKTSLGTIDGLKVLDTALTLDGVISIKKPCNISPVKIKIKNQPFESIGSINRERWELAPTVELWTDKSLRLTSKFYLDEGLTIPANEITSRFNNQVMSAWFDIEPTDVRAFRVREGMVIDLPEPIDFEVTPPMESNYIVIDRNIPFEKASDACQAFNSSWGGYLVNGYYQEDFIGEGVQLYEDPEFTTPLTFPYPQWLPMTNNTVKSSIQIANGGTVMSYGVC